MARARAAAAVASGLCLDRRTCHAQFRSAPLAAITLAVDCMGGDHGPRVTLPACRAFLERASRGRAAAGRRAGRAARPSGMAALHASSPATEVVEMDDSIEVALRRKKDSSMRVAIQQVKDGARARPRVSAGNTGALMAVARYLLKTLDGIDRPAIATVMPNAERRRHHGARPRRQCRLHAEHLLQFAVMGSALVVGASTARTSPRSACSTSAKKRSRAARRSRRPASCCAPRPSRGHLNFYGNVEGNDIFKGTTDIVVCDGFVGNVALKTAEGLASMLVELHQAGVHAQLSDASWRRSSRCRCSSASRRASIIAATTARRCSGLRGLVFKSHGSADAFAFEQALNRAYDAARNGLLDRVHDRIARDAASPAGEPMSRRRRRAWPKPHEPTPH